MAAELRTKSRTQKLFWQNREGEAGHLPTLSPDIAPAQPRGSPRFGSTLPAGWVIHAHPNGWVYFSCPARSLVTDLDIRDHAMLRLVEQRVQGYPNTFGVLSQATNSPIDWFIDMETGVEIYCVDHSRKRMALPPFKGLASDARDLTWNEEKLSKERYWNYFKNHPSHHPLPDGAAYLALLALRSNCVGSLVYADNSLDPFAPQECQRLIELLDSLSNDDTTPKNVLVSYILERVAAHTFDTGFGGHARAAFEDRKTHLSPTEPRGLKKWFMYFCIYIVFLGVPNSYIQPIQEALRTGAGVGAYAEQLKGEIWESYAQRVVEEWGDFILVATVLLSATGSFLAVPGLPSLARITTLISVLCALESIIIGMYLIWRHQAYKEQLKSTYHLNVERKYGPYGIAFLFSVPFVLLVWAIGTFAFSVVTYAFHGFTETAAGVQVPFDPATGYTAMAVHILFNIPFAVVLLRMGNTR
ncbi:hypothetical protein BOTBODRAFT_186485 [Botryobasidium botryosum FD-172 SS1]|uniref:WW domain-containing protein n=1 Tax=Botryobasidium botryosum (strain FD-172 SS1) TaxID=930990 RepID=A0A067MLM0_BOTB1|nr:hypothetical protein BOTBODRAFT_186485 [Botryobasidium botryosum FD-172 SS1]